ncbi:hypothetical protein DFJ74DRAFT_771965 [Hyaloraphidium curvatum]|nr:hypothetical protein DFJ74DRAFT_771965 [Hyaloraphidium curvatum]
MAPPTDALALLRAAAGRRLSLLAHAAVPRRAGPPRAGAAPRAGAVPRPAPRFARGFAAGGPDAAGGGEGSAGAAGAAGAAADAGVPAAEGAREGAAPEGKADAIAAEGPVGRAHATEGDSTEPAQQPAAASEASEAPGPRDAPRPGPPSAPAPPPPSAADAAYRLALAVIDAEVAKVRAELASLDARLADPDLADPDRALLAARRRNRADELAFADPQLRELLPARNAREFGTHPEDEALLPLKRDVFQKITLPILLDHMTRDAVLVDLFGLHDAFEPSVAVTALFEKERGIATERFSRRTDVPLVPLHMSPVSRYKGDGTECRRTPPKIKIESFPDGSAPRGREKLLTVAVMDLDYPRLDTASYESLLLSLHTNLPPRPILTLDLADPAHCAVPYLPPHPAKQSPNLWHRVVAVVCEQEGEVDIRLPEGREVEGVEGRSPWVRDHDGEGEQKHRIRERIAALPFLRMMRAHNLTPVGIAYWKVEWSPQASVIFRELGLHEPVLSLMPRDIPAFSRALRRTPDAASDPASLLALLGKERLSLSTDPEGGKRYDRASAVAGRGGNEGLEEPSSRPARMPTRAAETIARLEAEARAAELRRAEKSGKPAAEAPRFDFDRAGRMRAPVDPVVDVARAVRSREGVAGPVTAHEERVWRERAWRYQRRVRGENQ